MGVSSREAAPYLYPRFLASALIPLGFLPYVVAYKIWVLCQWLFLVIALLLLARAIPELGSYGLLMLVVIAAGMYPLTLSIDLGQVGTLVLMAISAVFLFARRGQFFLAGAALALAAAVKMSPLLLLGYFIFQRRWSAVAGLVVTGLSILVFSLVIAGPESIKSFVYINLGSAIPEQIRWHSNMSLAGVMYRLTDTIGMTGLESLLRVGSYVVIVTALAVLSLRRVDHRSPLFALNLSLWIVAMVLVSPISWEHHLIWLIPAYAATIAWIISANGMGLHLTNIALVLSYCVIAMENMPLNRPGQWRFASGWWFLSGEYLRLNFIADARFVAVILLGVCMTKLSILAQGLRKDATCDLRRSQGSCPDAAEDASLRSA